MDNKTNQTLNRVMISVAKIIKLTCTKRNGDCKGCIFNKLVSGKGDYDEVENKMGAFTDEDDKNGESETFCEAFFRDAPHCWNLDSKELNK